MLVEPVSRTAEAAVHTTVHETAFLSFASYASEKIDRAEANELRFQQTLNQLIRMQFVVLPIKSSWSFKIQIQLRFGVC
jgi:hypothetical protein